MTNDTPTTKNIFIIAGEASGDNLGAGLMRELSASTNGGVDFVGIGGVQMQSAGLKTLLPIEEIAVMGIWEVVWQLPRLLKIINGLVEEIESRQPDVLITIDAQDLSLQVASRLKKRGIFTGKLVHYVAPTVWAWRPGRAKKIAALYDVLLCLFPFEPAYFTPHNIDAKFIGHPLVEHGIDNVRGDAFRAANDIAADAPVLGVFLGSREREIKMMAAPFMQAIELIREQIPTLNVVIPTLPEVEYDVLEAMRKHNCVATIVSAQDMKWQAFAACDIGLAVSGTVGLELAYMGIPHVIGYKTHPATYVIIKALVKAKYAHLANILLDKAAVPEFLQHRCTPQNLAITLMRMFDDDGRAADSVNGDAPKADNDGTVHTINDSNDSSDNAALGQTAVQRADLKTLHTMLQPQGNEATPSAKAAAAVMDIM